jgi:hypothetical protein
MEVLINAGNVLYLVAYFARDMRWLRALTIAAAGLLAAYFYLRPEPVMTAVLWNLLFGALNAWQLLRLAAPRLPGLLKQYQASLPEKHGVGATRRPALAR